MQHLQGKLVYVDQFLPLTRRPEQGANAIERFAGATPIVGDIAQGFADFLNVGRLFLQNRQPGLGIDDHRRERLLDLVRYGSRSRLDVHQLVASLPLQHQTAPARRAPSARTRPAGAMPPRGRSCADAAWPAHWTVTPRDRRLPA